MALMGFNPLVCFFFLDVITTIYQIDYEALLDGHFK